MAAITGMILPIEPGKLHNCVKLKGYSRKTGKAYQNCKKILDCMGGDQFSADFIKRFILNLFEKGLHSHSDISQNA